MLLVKSRWLLLTKRRHLEKKSSNFFLHFVIRLLTNNFNSTTDFQFFSSLCKAFLNYSIHTDNAVCNRFDHITLLLHPLFDQRHLQPDQCPSTSECADLIFWFWRADPFAFQIAGGIYEFFLYEKILFCVYNFRLHHGHKWSIFIKLLWFDFDFLNLYPASCKSW